MRIGVIADTHLQSQQECRRFSDRLLDGPFHSVDMIFHAGDLGNSELLFCLAPCPVVAVAGNTDRPHPELPPQRLLTLEGRRIVLAHGWGGGDSVAADLLRHFGPERPDVIVFGHSHVPENRRVGKTLLFNPGSPTRPRSSVGATVGVLEIVGGEVAGEILPWRD
ncbi:hypothetical protein EDC39_102220 [Geothermobacter ehrlichii]|uniref:Phosphoesterase n=1 Tax=Geothermobacter ehrlichii TaxID=213224 RepID=A0A5D3WL16_9BACT|nr:metallophosphoesterase family protein [Geothermobacter ehrlichii]TYO99694.1 hypothetical protein EDC39_102220 [Geothermobacter ehrlichii]